MFRAIIILAFATWCNMAVQAAVLSVVDSSEPTVIYIDGDIEADDLEVFRQVSIGHKDAVVVLDSNGGQLLPAIEIGKIIKIAGYKTFVDDDAVCASSCALMWLAGEQRYMSSSGRVGFHASYRNINGKLEESGVANALIGNYLTKLNLPEKAIVFATSAPPDKIMWLTNANKVSSGIHFESVDPDKKEQNVEQSAVTSQPSTYLAPPQTAPVSSLPSDFPSRLKSASYDWVNFAGRSYYDAKSIVLVKNFQGQSTGWQVWAVVNLNSPNQPKIHYSMVRYLVQCAGQSVYIRHWEDYRKDGKRKVKETTSIPLPAAPGTAERLLVEKVCR